MSTTLQFADGLLPIYGAAERRSKPRIDKPFTAVVHGMDVRGKAFEISTQLDNLSACGLYIKLAQCVEPGTKLCALIHFSAAPPARVDAPQVAVEGIVLRVELNQTGAYGVALGFTHYRFL